MFVTIPDKNLSKNLRGWTKSWSLLCLSIQVQKLNAILVAISKQKQRIFYATGFVKRTGPSLASLELEAIIMTTTERLIMLLGDYDVESASLKGINDPSPRLSSSNSVTRGTPPTTVLKNPSDRVPFPTYPGLQMPPKSYQPEGKKVGNGLIH
ncbi:hypothetical protein GALMADRAFT_236915 [Galerina marginata CBS 339.88]|uniref:Uncharacterized protein n=1 Tax=Galerina marginata (strain CBS 339.88) TaxID=685588 RepID=A0A067TPH5_GALM3|nr:hypothetical protein GALMADRAFT_236915 [Galerina marginata CBS 339.88]